MATDTIAPGIPATLRPSEDIIDRALRHLRNGIMGHASRGANSLILPSGNGGIPHVTERNGDRLTCTCMAGQKNQPCWAQAVYQLVSGLAAEWDAPDPMHYTMPDVETEGAEPREADPEPAAEPTSEKPKAQRKRTNKVAAVAKLVGELADLELIRPAPGKKVAWFGQSGFGVLDRFLQVAEKNLGEEEALRSFQTALAATHVNGTCAVCASPLLPFSGGRNLVCWDHGLIVPAPQREEKAA